MTLKLQARINDLTVTSDSIQVTTKGAFSFTYLEATVGSVIEENGDVKEEIVVLNLFDSGPQDCEYPHFPIAKRR